jgi:hypothetical protein
LLSTTAAFGRLEGAYILENRSSLKQQ